MKEMALLEKERVEAEAREAKLHASMKDTKKKLLDDLAGMVVISKYLCLCKPKNTRFVCRINQTNHICPFH